MNKYLLFFCAVFLCGCMVKHDAVLAEEGQADGLVGYLSEQKRCVSAWRSVIDDWVENGGGIRSTVSETRQAIARDERSKLALIIRQVWKRQSRSVSVDHRKTALIFDTVASREMTEECSSIIWLQALLVEPTGVIPENVMASLLAEAPIEVRDDSRKFGLWLSYELLTPEPGWRKEH
ncbi:MAG: hypothetical protein JF600_16190 [Xanthomonadales bacterium]|nr:hypothetical protein [Xanthomonadales bacterium]